MVNAGNPGPRLALKRRANLPSFPTMHVPLLDLSAEYQSLAGPIRSRIDQILSTQKFILGPHLENFEKAIEKFTGSPHAIGVSSGTDALLIAYMALGLGRDDAIITTPYS